MTRPDDPRDETYLWDRSGEPDPDVVALEGTLARHRHRAPLGSLPARRWSVALARRAAVALATAVAIVLALLWDRGRGEAPDPAGYRLHVLSGSPVVEVGGGSTGPADAPLRPGSRLRLDAGARARLAVGSIGSVVLEERTALRIEDAKDADDAEYLLYLEHGTMTASIFAAPRLFQVGTPAGMTVDMGCVYQSTVFEENGNTELRVISGQVAFETARRKVTVPAGASVLAFPDKGPGTPVWDDAPEALRLSVQLLDLGLQESGLLASIVEAARDEDSLTLWHLLTVEVLQVSPEEDAAGRALVCDRLAAITPPPADVTRAGVLAGDAAMLECWKDALDRSW